MSQTVTVTPVHPFKITGVSASPGERIRVDFSEVERGEQVVYEVRVTNTCNEPMRYYEKVVVRTDSADRPEFTISVQGYLRRPVSHGEANK